MADGGTAAHVALLLRAEIPGVRARLIGALRDFDLAEDALQDALVLAWEHWPVTGVPDRPAAWLYRVAERRGVDAIRHESVVQRHASDVEGHEAHAPEPEALLAQADFDDDLLRLIFVCCHPSLRPDVRAALTLRTVLDMSLEQVARAFLVPPRTLEQRLVRAKRRLKNDSIEWAVPAGAELPARLGDVLRVVYLIFTEGYSATSGDTLTRPELCALAIGLMRRIVRLVRGRAEALALLALMLLQDSRSAGRADADGEPILLENQDRSAWDSSKVREGTVLLEKALCLRQAPGPYQIQAAIAAVHANAPDAGHTDWDEIAALYDALRRVEDTPVVRLNRAVAIAMARGAAAGLAELDRLKHIAALRGFHPYHAARGALLWRLERQEQALTSYRQALGLVRNQAEETFLRRCIARLEAGEPFSVSGRRAAPARPASRVPTTGPGTPRSC